MARFARVIVPGIAYHIVDRGNRRNDVFFSEADKHLYMQLLRKNGERFGISYLAYCLMDNHVHLVAIPRSRESFAKAMAEIKRKYTAIMNFKNGWSGKLWQGRFGSFPMDEPHLYSAVRYVERNPVRARMVGRAEDFQWSSAKAHVAGQDDPHLPLLDSGKILAIKNWADYLHDPDDEEFLATVRKLGRTGRPLGSEGFIKTLELLTGRALAPRTRGKARTALFPA